MPAWPSRSSALLTLYVYRVPVFADRSVTTALPAKMKASACSAFNRLLSITTSSDRPETGRSVQVLLGANHKARLLGHLGDVQHIRVSVVHQYGGRCRPSVALPRNRLRFARAGSIDHNHRSV